MLRRKKFREADEVTCLKKRRNEKTGEEIGKHGSK